MLIQRPLSTLVSSLTEITVTPIHPITTVVLWHGLFFCDLVSHLSWPLSFWFLSPEFWIRHLCLAKKGHIHKLLNAYLHLISPFSIQVSRVSAAYLICYKVICFWNIFPNYIYICQHMYTLHFRSLLLNIFPVCWVFPHLWAPSQQELGDIAKTLPLSVLPWAFPQPACSVCVLLPLSLYFCQLCWVCSRAFTLTDNKMFESKRVGLASQKARKISCYIYTSCKAAGVALKEIDVET